MANFSVNPMSSVPPFQPAPLNTPVNSAASSIPGAFPMIEALPELPSPAELMAPSQQPAAQPSVPTTPNLTPPPAPALPQEAPASFGPQMMPPDMPGLEMSNPIAPQQAMDALPPEVMALLNASQATPAQQGAMALPPGNMGNPGIPGQQLNVQA